MFAVRFREGNFPSRESHEFPSKPGRNRPKHPSSRKSSTFDNSAPFHISLDVLNSDTPGAVPAAPATERYRKGTGHVATPHAHFQTRFFTRGLSRKDNQ